MGWVSLVALGLGGGAVIAVVLAAAARRAFLGRVTLRFLTPANGPSKATRSVWWTKTAGLRNRV
jgi:hypothetical protein